MQGPFLASGEGSWFTEHSWPANSTRYHVKGMSGSDCRCICFEAAFASPCVCKSVHNPATFTANILIPSKRTQAQPVHRLEVMLK